MNQIWKQFEINLTERKAENQPSATDLFVLGNWYPDLPQATHQKLPYCLTALDLMSYLPHRFDVIVAKPFKSLEYKCMNAPPNVCRSQKLRLEESKDNFQSQNNILLLVAT